MSERKHDLSWVFNAAILDKEMTRRAMSPYHLELACGIDHSAIWKLRDGRSRNPTAATLLTIADALDLDPRDLMIRQW